MKVEKHTPSMTHDALHCASTGETIPFDLYLELIESTDAIIAFWLGGNGVDYPIIKDKAFEDAWNEIFQPWLDADEVEVDFFEMLESFLEAYPNPQWKVMQCTFTFAYCTGPVKDTMYFVVKSDTSCVPLADLQPEFDADGFFGDCHCGEPLEGGDNSQFISDEDIQALLDEKFPDEEGEKPAS